jgi:uncharacterized protein YoaH (UPF0181 family)
MTDVERSQAEARVIQGLIDQRQMSMGDAIRLVAQRVAKLDKRRAVSCDRVFAN